MNRLTFFPAFLAVISMASSAAPVAPAPDSVPFTYETASDVKPEPLPGACRINVMTVRDARPSIGRLSADTALTSGPTEQWISDSFDALKAYGFTVEHSKTPVPKVVNLDVTLIRAYTWFGNMRINGMVAMDLGFQRPTGSTTEKFRASGSKTNMWGAKAEFVTALNYALNHTLHNVASALQRECASVR